MTDIHDSVSKLQKKIANAQTEINKLEGALETRMSQLAELGFESIPDAEAAVLKYEKKIKRLDNTIKTKYNLLKAKMDENV